MKSPWGSSGQLPISQADLTALDDGEGFTSLAPPWPTEPAALPPREHDDETVSETVSLSIPVAARGRDTRVSAATNKGLEHDDAPLRPLLPEERTSPPSLSARLVQRWKLLLLLCVVGVAYGGYALYDFKRPYEWSGTVEAKIVSLGSRTGGRVQKVLISEGELVNPGQPLVVLEVGDLEARKTIAQAELDAADAHLEKLSNGARPEELAQAQARLLEAKAAAASAQSIAGQQANELARAKSLHATGAISISEQDTRSASARASGATAMQAGAHLQEANAALKLLVGGTREEDLRSAKAAQAAARGRFQIIQNQLDELTIRAPVRARVETVAVRPGDLVHPDGLAVTISEESQLFVRIYVPETLMGKIAIGQKLPIYVESFPKRTFQGTVEHINTVGEFTPRNVASPDEKANEVFAARIALQEGHAELRAGMGAFIRIKK